MMGIRVPAIRLAMRRGANERVWSVDVKCAPMQSLISYPLMDLLSLGLSEIQPARTPFSSLVEAAMRTDGEHGHAWRADLEAHLEGARPPESLSFDPREPIVRRTSATAKFALSFPSLEIIVPALRHTSDCHSLRVRLSGLDIDGVAINEPTFKSARRLRMESVDVALRCAGAPQYHALIPAVHNVRGTLASLAVLSPGFVVEYSHPPSTDSRPSGNRPRETVKQQQ